MDTGTEVRNARPAGSRQVLRAFKSRFFWTGNSWLPGPPLDLFIGAKGPIESALLPPSVLALETYAKVTGLRRVTIVN